ncbi:MAG: ABC transporter permease subunit [Thermoleophilaceae bacterium]|nr:ABC transporter permease subunit [Thermoleophilaceae bacterium]
MAAAGSWRPTSAADSLESWPLVDRIGYRLAWAAGAALCLVAGAIVLYMAVRGVQYLDPGQITQAPTAELDQSKSGGFFDPLLGTVLLTILGTAIAAPLGVATAIWLTEYGRPAGLARVVESGVEVVAGTPTIVLAIFGLLVFQQQFFGFLSLTAEGDAVLGRSFLVAATMMSLIALPLVVGATREALQSVPGHVREASYALGKTKAATIRRVLLPAVRPGIGTGAALGMGRIAGDTAIVLILLGGTLQLEEANSVPLIGDLKGTGSTLTSYVYISSPAGEGNAPEKAYAAAFVLLMIVIALNFSIDRIARGRTPAWSR